jgi:hypothetical protein
VEAVRAAPALAALLLAAVALAHLLRLLFRVEVTAGGIVLPMWLSVFGFLVPGALSVALWRGRRG